MTVHHDFCVANASASDYDYCLAASMHASDWALLGAFALSLMLTLFALAWAVERRGGQ